MATESVGGVSYSVDVDLGDLNQLDAKIDQVGKSAGQSFSAVDKSINKAQASMGNLNKTSAAVSNAFKVQKGAAQQLSFQLQDVVVQAQMGTSAFTIIAQQAPQILSLAGAGGALLGVVVALAAAIGGVFFASMQDSSSAADELQKTMKRLDDVISETDGGVKVLSNEFVKLANASKNIAAAQIIIGMNDAKKAIQQAGAAITESFGADFGFTGLKELVDIYAGGRGIRSFDAFNEIIQETGEELGFAGDEAQKVGRRIFDLLVIAERDRTPEALANLQEYLSGLVNESGKANTKLTEFTGRLNEFFSQARTAAEAIQFFTEAQSDLDKALSTSTETAVEAKNSLSQLISTIQKQADTVGLTQRGVALYTAEQLGATAADKQRINELFNLIDAQERADEIEKARITNAERALSLQARQIAQDQARAVAESNRRTSDFQSAKSGAMRDLESPADAAKREMTERLEAIRSFYKLESEEQAKRTEAGILAEQAYQAKLTQIKKQEEDKRLQMNNTTLGATADLFGNLASLAEQGGKDSFNAWKVFASAQAAVNAALAITNVLATVPPPLSFALAGSVAVLTGAQIGKIASTNYGGGRLYGGPVSPGKMYPITENGKPEILQQGSNSYLLPGSRGGNVISNNDMQQVASGSAVNVQVNVQNNNGSSIDVRRSTGPDRNEIIDIIVADIQGRGRTQRAITNTTTASNKI